jgi:hypothetical protein
LSPVVLDVELGGVDADEYQAVVLVLVGPGAEVGRVRSQLMQV